MSVTIPKSHQDLLDNPVCVTLSTLMADGQPQSTQVWCTYDGTYIKVNTARGRRKEQNMSARPQVTLMAVDPKNPYRWLEVRGKVEQIEEEGALEHINQLAKSYANKPSYYGGVAPAELEQKEVRVICKIKPLKVTPFQMGG